MVRGELWAWARASQIAEPMWVAERQPATQLQATEVLPSGGILQGILFVWGLVGSLESDIALGGINRIRWKEPKV